MADRDINATSKRFFGTGVVARFRGQKSRRCPQ